MEKKPIDANSTPVPGWLIDLLLAAGLFYGSTPSEAMAAKILADMIEDRSVA